MQPIVFSESKWFTRPWHVQLAGVYTFNTLDTVLFNLERGRYSICDYIQLVIIGALFATIATVICSIGAAAIGDTLAWLVAGMMTTFVEPEHLANIVLIILAGSVFLVVLFALFAVLYHLYEQFNRKYSNTTAVAVDRSVVHKICVPVQYRSSKQD
jgi:inner membrane protein involved in colicin E2 resistance